jgi:hypothetical protein
MFAQAFILASLLLFLSVAERKHILPYVGGHVPRRWTDQHCTLATAASAAKVKRGGM